MDDVAIDAKRILLRYGAPINVLDDVADPERIELARLIAKTSLPDRERHLRQVLADRGYMEPPPLKPRRSRKLVAAAPAESPGGAAPAAEGQPAPAPIAMKPRKSGGSSSSTKFGANLRRVKAAKVAAPAKPAVAAKSPAPAKPAVAAKSPVPAKPPVAAKPVPKPAPAARPAAKAGSAGKTKPAAVKAAKSAKTAKAAKAAKTAKATKPGKAAKAPTRKPAKAARKAVKPARKSVKKPIARPGATRRK